MPELPEVETIRSELAPSIIGRRISGVTLCDDRILRCPPAEEFCSRITDREITGLTRRGKYLMFGLDSGDLMVIHLRMTGSLLLEPGSSSDGRFVRAVIHFDGGTDIVFRDPRKFGVIWLAEDRDSITCRLGPEPLEPDFTAEVLTRRLAKRTAPVKALLLDQHVVAGIGNMYADEALFAAGIHPLRAGGSLSPAEIKKLHGAVQRVLRAAIGNKGASVENYYRPDGTTGTAHFQFQVAHRLGGDTCPVCGTPIERLAVRNRGSYFCPRCQPLG
ncbi:bifunctional DNA-formamidopyrimidine glycosylase/DNA-(apurinic or apyrimidinic site) lyase [Chloroflexota bacterium]